MQTADIESECYKISRYVYIAVNPDRVYVLPLILLCPVLWD